MHIYVFIFIVFHSSTAPAIDDLDEVSDGLSKVHLAHCDCLGSEARRQPRSLTNLSRVPLRISVRVLQGALLGCIKGTLMIMEMSLGYTCDRIAKNGPQA